MKVTDNGRMSLPQLQEKFDKVIIRYLPGVQVDDNGVEKDVVKTLAILLLGSNVHVGVSKWSNRGYNFSKTRGRAMALGRAEIAYNVFNKTEHDRKAHVDGTDPLSYTTSISGEATTENIIDSLIAVEDMTKI